MATATPDLAALKSRQQAAWSSGDYAVIGVSIVLIAEQLCEAVDLRAGWHVLDVAAGNGNASLAAARRHCTVTSTDYVPALLERGRLRAEADQLSAAIKFEGADVENLPYADASFDAVLSTVGIMFAPDQARSAAEVFRVTKPGGVLGFASWTPEGFVGQIFRIMSSYLPPPAGAKPPSRWGTEAALRELFPEAKEIRTTKRAFHFRALSAQAWLDEFKRFYGPMLKAFAALDEPKQASLAAELIALCDSLNISGDSTLVLPSEYLEAVIRK